MVKSGNPQNAVRVMKALRDAPPAAVVERRRGVMRKRRQKEVESNDDDGLIATGWIFHEEVLELLSRFVTRLTTKAAASGICPRGHSVS